MPLDLQPEEYLHINRTVAWGRHPPLRVGDVFRAGDDYNPYFRYFYDQHLRATVRLPSGKDAVIGRVKYYEDVAAGRVTDHALAIGALQTIKHFVKLAGELIWEDVRSNEFPHLPSRQRCIWLIQDLENLGHWVSRLECSFPGTQILKVKVDGNLHVGDETLLLGDSHPLVETYECARRYWRGEMSQSAKPEILFEGEVKVTEILQVRVDPPPTPWLAS